MEREKQKQEQVEVEVKRRSERLVSKGEQQGHFAQELFENDHVKHPTLNLKFQRKCQFWS